MPRSDKGDGRSRLSSSLHFLILLDSPLQGRYHGSNQSGNHGVLHPCSGNLEGGRVQGEELASAEAKMPGLVSDELKPESSGDRGCVGSLVTGEELALWYRSRLPRLAAVRLEETEATIMTTTSCVRFPSALFPIHASSLFRALVSPFCFCRTVVVDFIFLQHSGASALERSLTATTV